MSHKHKANPNYKYSILYCFDDEGSVSAGTFDTQEEALAKFKSSVGYYKGNNVNFAGVVKHAAGEYAVERVLKLNSANKT